MIPRFVAFAASWLVDKLGDHFQSCNLGGNRQIFHNGLRKSVALICRLVGTMQEERHLHTIGPLPPEMVNLRMDIVMDDDVADVTPGVRPLIRQS